MPLPRCNPARAAQNKEREFALGLSLHVADVYTSCLAPAAPPPAALRVLLSPFVALLAQAGHPALVARARGGVLEPLARGDAELALTPAELQARTTQNRL